jgi:hypothetical protein
MLLEPDLSIFRWQPDCEYFTIYLLQRVRNKEGPSATYLFYQDSKITQHLLIHTDGQMNMILLALPDLPC